MKFWVKTYFCVLVLFIFILNSSICLIVYTTYQSMLSSEKDKARVENNYIRESLSDDILSLNSNKKLSEQAIKNLMEYYSSYYQKQGLSFRLSHNKSIIFSNLPFEIKNPNINSLYNNAIVSDREKDRYILISNSLNNSNNQYTFVYCSKLDRMMDVWRKIEKTIILFSFVSSLLLSALLAWLLNRRSKPLTQLINHVNNVKNGIYDTRVEIRGKDEFSILGNNFNEMSGKIRANMEQLNNDMKNKQQFIDNLSHELRTPLTSIHGYAEYIQKAAITEEDKYEATLCIMEESKRLQYMAARMLDISLLRQASISKTEINADELFRKILKTILPILNEKSIKINVSNELKHIMGEQPLIESLLINLLDNAIKASDMHQSILLAGFIKNGDAVIQITDNGKGVSTEHLAHLTEPFYRADKSRSKSEGGTGLGLTICKQIMDLHKGRLEFASVLNKGTTVSLTFTFS